MKVHELSPEGVNGVRLSEERNARNKKSNFPNFPTFWPLMLDQWFRSLFLCLQTSNLLQDLTERFVCLLFPGVSVHQNFPALFCIAPKHSDVAVLSSADRKSCTDWFNPPPLPPPPASTYEPSYKGFFCVQRSTSGKSHVMGKPAHT